MAAHVKTKYDTEIARLKNKAGLSYEEISNRLNCSRNYVWMLCAGVRACPLDFKEALIALAYDRGPKHAVDDITYWQSQYALLVDKHGTHDYETWPDAVMQAAE
jgi:transcriptional regulator with XRE-family HTH domain